MITWNNLMWGQVGATVSRGGKWTQVGACGIHTNNNKTSKIVWENNKN